MGIQIFLLLIQNKIILQSNQVASNCFLNKKKQVYKGVNWDGSEMESKNQMGKEVEEEEEGPHQPRIVVRPIRRQKNTVTDLLLPRIT